MTSGEVIELAPRHVWGWIFILLFLIELIVFGSLVWTRKAKIEQLRGYLDTKIAYLRYVEIEDQRKQLNEIYLGSGIVLAGTLVCAAIGLRRRKAPLG
jgi:hypothetical protein